MTIMINFRVTAELRDRLAALSVKSGRTRTVLAVEALTWYLDEQESQVAEVIAALEEKAERNIAPERNPDAGVEVLADLHARFDRRR